MVFVCPITSQPVSRFDKQPSEMVAARLAQQFECSNEGCHLWLPPMMFADTGVSASRPHLDSFSEDASIKYQPLNISKVTWQRSTAARHRCPCCEPQAFLMANSNCLGSANLPTFCSGELGLPMRTIRSKPTNPMFTSQNHQRIDWKLCNVHQLCFLRICLVMKHECTMVAPTSAVISWGRQVFYSIPTSDGWFVVWPQPKICVISPISPNIPRMVKKWGKTETQMFATSRQILAVIEQSRSTISHC